MQKTNYEFFIMKIQLQNHCDELISRPEDSYLLCCVVECDLETSSMRTSWPALSRSAKGRKK